ncbi:MAG: protein kinase [Verrucomicrobiales bacterium]|nr:protein kinase [Verrucomicrobiales bacterium]
MLSNIGRYRVLKQLARGDISLVVLARDEEKDQNITIKIFSDGGGDSENLKNQFLHGATAQAKLKHSHIIPVYEIDQTEDGSPYIVMKAIKCQTFDQALGISRNSREFESSIDAIVPITKPKVSSPPDYQAIRKTLRWLRDIVSAIAYAHESDITHQNLTPSNLLIDLDLKAWVTSFGRTESVDSKSDISSELFYLAPEQIINNSETADGRADIWALGVILYEAVTGQLPFCGESRSDLLNQIEGKQPIPPRQRNPKLSLRIENVCLKCLQKDPADRYRTAKDLKQALRDAQGAEHAWASWIVRHPIFALFGLVFGIVGTFVTINESLEQTPHAQASLLAGNELRCESLELLVWNENVDRRKGLSVTKDFRALPLQSGDSVRLQAELNRSAYCYLIWIEPDGNLSPVFPWEDGHWEKIPKSESKTITLSLPAIANRGWPITPTRGMETLILLAREEPLSRDVNIRSLLANLPPQPFRPNNMIFEFDAETIEIRGADFTSSAPLQDPFIKLRSKIFRQLDSNFDLVCGITFANDSKKNK